MSAALWVALLWLGGQAQVPERDRLRTAQVECVGPLHSLRLAWPDGEGSSVTLELAAGEQRTLAVPIAARSGGADLRPLLSVDGVGEARWLGWLDAARAAAVERWERLPLGLRLRARPAPPGGGPSSLRPSLASLLLAGAGFLTVLRLRASPRAALAAGLGAGALVLLLAGTRAVGGRTLELLDGDDAAWLLARTARERLAFDPDAGLLLSAVPPGVALEVRGHAAPGATWELLAAGADLWSLDPQDPDPLRLLAGGRNVLGDFDACWLRDPGGEWLQLGAWPLGRGLPDPQVAAPGDAPPAAWVAGLPPGRPVFLGRRASSDGSESWVRQVGFRAPQ